MTELISKREMFYHDLIIQNDNIKKDILSIINSETDLSQLNLIHEDKDNESMNHAKKTVDRFKYIKEGGNITDVMDELPNELKISSFYSRGNTMRLHMDKLSPTLVPGHSNFPVHPKEHRSITVREAAVITGFPMDYKFFGNHSKRCEHVGNAVPPPLASAIAKECANLLNEYYENKKLHPTKN